MGLLDAETPDQNKGFLFPGDVPVAYILLMYCNTMPWLQGIKHLSF